MSLLWRRVQQSPSTCSSPPFPQLQPAPAENCHCLFGGFTCLMISQTQSRAESHLPANSVCLYSWGLALDPCFGLSSVALRRFCRGVCHGRKQRGRCRAPSHGESASADSGQVCPSSPGQSQPHSPVAADSAGSASAAVRVVASPVVYMQRTDLRLGRGELTVLLEDRPAIDTGVYFHLSDLAMMRRRDLVGVLGSMGQAVGKRRPTWLELLLPC